LENGSNELMGGNVGVLLSRRASEMGSARFVRCGDFWRTFSDVDVASSAIAGGLDQAGVRRGDRVATIMSNRMEAIEMVFACAKLGAILVPLNPFLKGEFLRHQLTDSGSVGLVVDAAGLRSAVSFLERTAIRTVVTVESIPESMDIPVLDYRSLLGASPGVLQEFASGSDPLAILYTSGTTGLPKGCLISHDYICVSPEAWMTAGWLQSDDVQFAAFPLFHMGGLAIIFFALISTAPVMFQPSFSAGTFIGEAAAENATLLHGVGAVGLALLAQPPRANDRDHHFRLASFVPMTSLDQVAFKDRFATRVISEIYGQTECLPVTISPLGDDRRPESIGRAAPHLEVRLVDDTDNEVEVGQVGEIVVRPRRPGVMFSGYHNLTDETLAACRNYWHHTGDFGRTDEGGYFFYVDRKKDFLRRRGENVSSLELEEAIRRHPKVESVAVCQMPSELSEDEIRAFVVFVPASQPSPIELFHYFQQTMPYFAIPRYVTACDALPLTPTGRVQKHILRAQPLNSRTWDFDGMGLRVPVSDRRN
jgi:crotonobetaine/carnitine-CoA ligase